MGYYVGNFGSRDENSFHENFFSKLPKGIGDFLHDSQRFLQNAIDNIGSAYGDVIQGGVNAKHFEPWMSLVPGFNALQEYADKNSQWSDYYSNVGRYPSYTSRMHTFGNLSDLASALGSDAKSLFSVGKLYKNI